MTHDEIDRIAHDVISAIRTPTEKGDKVLMLIAESPWCRDILSRIRYVLQGEVVR